jgi:flagellar hook protein FlgE
VLRSLFSGITGLRQHQTLMDVVSNNIANVNTTGFKSSSVTFQDTLSQLVRAAASPGNGVGGINPAQVGLGVQLGSITSNFGQGSAQNTGKSTDLMIQGDGFFIVRNGNDTNFTRAGAFTFDTSGRLVNPEGMIVQGWLGEDGTVNTDGAVEDLVIPAGTLIPPIASDTVTVGGNIPSGTTSDLTLSQTVYDSAGNAHDLSIVFSVSAAVDGFDIDITDTTDGTSVPTAGTVAFNADGSYDSTSGDSVAPYITLADSTVVTLDITGITRYGGSKSLGVSESTGAAAGSLQSFQISKNGDVIGVFSNGEKLTMATIALANFNNPMGLEKIGGTCFQSTTNSGIAQVGTPMSGGRGSLLGSALEMSNVDLAQEFTNLIIAQRGFQANSRVITTSDRMLQDLFDLKR